MTKCLLLILMLLQINFAISQKWQKINLSLDNYFYNEEKELIGITIKIEFQDISVISDFFLRIGDSICAINNGIIIHKENNHYYINDLSPTNKVFFKGNKIVFKQIFPCKLKKITLAYMNYIDTCKGYSKLYYFPLSNK